MDIAGHERELEVASAVKTRDKVVGVFSNVDSVSECPSPCSNLPEQENFISQPKCRVFKRVEKNLTCMEGSLRSAEQRKTVFCLRAKARAPVGQFSTSVVRMSKGGANMALSTSLKTSASQREAALGVFAEKLTVKCRCPSTCLRPR